MKQILFSWVGAGLLLFGVSMSVQAAPQDRGSWYEERDTFYHGNDWRMHMFDRVRDDLNHVQETTFRGSDQYRIARTKEQLNDLQGKMAAHQYDQPELDQVIAGMQRVVADNHLSSRDRDMLADDLTRLRDYREHHESWR